MHQIRSQVTAVVVAGLLVFAGSAVGSYAANGGPLLLGKSNKATKTTTIKSGKGPALKLKAKGTAPPLAVSNSNKVVKLNADVLDGLDSSALVTQAYVYTLTASVSNGDSGADFHFPGLPPGRYQVSYTVTGRSTGAPALAYCLFQDSVTAPTTLDVEGAGEINGLTWLVVGSGYLDTTTLPRELVCSDGTSTGFTIPLQAGGVARPARVVFTRLDSVTAAGSTG